MATEETKSSLDLSELELTEAQTHINLIQKAYRKLDSSHYAARELENDFRDLINVHIQQKGGDPNQQYTLNTDTGVLEIVTEEMQQQLGQADSNGAEPPRPSSDDIDPTGNFKFGDETEEEDGSGFEDASV